MNTDPSFADDHVSASSHKLTEASSSFCAKHRWKAALIFGVVLVACTAGVVLYLHVPKYQASAWIIIESTEPWIAFEQRGDRDSSNRYTETQIKMLRSPIVLGTVLSRSEVVSLAELKEEVDPLEHLRENLRISQVVGKSELYKIEYVSPSPLSARTVVNAVVVEYLSSQTDENFSRSQRIIDILEKERDGRSLDVERLRSRVMELAKDISGTDPFGHGVVTDPGKSFSPVTTLGPMLVELDVNRDVLKAEIQALQEAPALEPDRTRSSGLSDQDIDSRPEIRGWQAAIDGIDSFLEEMKDLEANWRDNSDMVDLVNALQSQQTALGELKQELREHLLQQQNIKQVPSRQQSIATMEGELAKLDMKKKLLSEQFGRQTKGLKDVGAKCVQFEFAKAELAREEKIFELIAARKLALQTEMRAPARVRLKKKADVPSAPLDPVPYKALWIGCLTAFAVPFALAFVFRPAKRES